MSKPARPRLAIATLALALLSSSACASLPGASPGGSLGRSSSPAAATAVPGGPLVIVTTRGGECMDGPCGSVTIIDRDGTVRSDDPAAAPLGTVELATLTALDAAIKTTDFDTLRSVPFEGECPVNFDGQEFIYEFQAPGGLERISSCETAIDAAHPVFAAITAALADVDTAPSP